MTPRNILIADSGSTKTQWCMVAADGTVVDNFLTAGINPALMPAAVVDTAIGQALRKRRLTPTAIYYYGAGCTPDRAYVIETALRRLYPQAEAHVHSDLLGAVRALCGREEGIACILGTGMASCLCKDGQIVQQTPSLGYILGDEGSGAVLGRKLIGAILKQALPKHLCEAWQTQYQLTTADIIENVYRKPQANKFLASFAPFIAQHLDEESMQKLVVEEFRNFFQRNIVPYQRPDLKVHFVGSIATHFRNELQAAAAAEGFQIGSVLQAPIGNLASYHAAT